MLASVSVQAQGFEYEGLNYTSLTDSTAQVGLNSDVKGDIVIPDSVSFNGKRLKVTAIGENAFYTWFLSEGITSVVLPKVLSLLAITLFTIRIVFRPLTSPRRWSISVSALCRIPA